MTGCSVFYQHSSAEYAIVCDYDWVPFTRFLKSTILKGENRDRALLPHAVSSRNNPACKSAVGLSL